MTKTKKSPIIISAIIFVFLVLSGALLGWCLAETKNIINSEYITEFDIALPTKLLDINGEIITEFASDEKREIIAYQELPQHMIDALITREDRIFFSHNGFSFKALFRAVLGQVFGKSLGGGSTLSQQIAGTLYCDRTEKSIKRKVKELWWAIQMERRYSKNEILELYLNKIYFGGGTYGVNAASKYYFGHDATEITPAEAAILVIQLSNPAHYNPFNYPNRAMDRQQNVLASMVNLGYITQEESEESFNDYWGTFDYTRTSSSAYMMR
ncbi:MAG: transglycosylase domain-containing protein, partial [Treponema sp.]|nr:transglycosylase domain-containing protein [Treponema sp.]